MEDEEKLCWIAYTSILKDEQDEEEKKNKMKDKRSPHRFY
tara:strand:- start:321 stop:440 length:120 start_codon:yes stop_codon:yes gene_type:complete